MRYSRTLLPNLSKTGKFSGAPWQFGVPPSGGILKFPAFPLKAVLQTIRGLNGTLLQRPLILLGTSILGQLNKVKRDGEEKQNVNRAALMQDKLKHKPDK